MSPLSSLRWLQVLQRVQYRLAVLTYKVLLGEAPQYLGLLICVDDLPVDEQCAVSRLCLVELPVKLSTVWQLSLCACCSSHDHIWNRLPIDVTSANPLLTVQLPLNCFLLQQSYLNIIY